MYIVAIAWLYVTFLMAVSERSWVAGVMTFVTFGLAPLLIFLWIVGTPQRRRNAQRAAIASELTALDAQSNDHHASDAIDVPGALNDAAKSAPPSDR